MFVRLILLVVVAVLQGLAGAPALAQTLSDENVLVVYNSAVNEANGGGGKEIFDLYSSLRGRTDVIGLDLNDATLLPGNISYAQFISKIRTPIRNKLTSEKLTQQVLVIVLTRGIPHRIAGLNEGSPVSNSSNSLVGDNPPKASALLNADNLTFASVDSELSLLFQDLESGESGGAFDSPADNFIRNPFFESMTSLAGTDRSRVQTARVYRSEAGYYQVPRTYSRPFRDDPTSTDQLFLTCRLDGDSVADVIGMLARANTVFIDPATDHFIIDEFDPSAGGPGSGGNELDASAFTNTERWIDAGGDFDQLATDLSNSTEGFAEVDFDEGSPFLIGEFGTVADPGATVVKGPVASLFSIGGNTASNGKQNNYINTFFDSSTGESQFVPGAWFSSIESYNARAFGGLAQFADQGSLAEFIAAGGTFSVGTVFEPFTLGVNEVDILIDRHLIQNWTFVEAAFASVPFVSSQTVIVGDPLAKVTLGPRPTEVEAFTVSLAPRISFPTEAGVHYTVSRSTDGKTFSSIATVIGTGSQMSVVDTNELESGVIYRVRVQ